MQLYRSQITIKIFRSSYCQHYSSILLLPAVHTAVRTLRLNFIWARYSLGKVDISSTMLFA